MTKWVIHCICPPDSAGASEAAISLMLEREERWRERDAKLIAEQWRSMQRAQQVRCGNLAGCRAWHEITAVLLEMSRVLCVFMQCRLCHVPSQSCKRKCKEIRRSTRNATQSKRLIVSTFIFAAIHTSFDDTIVLFLSAACAEGGGCAAAGCKPAKLRASPAGPRGERGATHGDGARQGG